jgi:hypothetical protein
MDVPPLLSVGLFLTGVINAALPDLVCLLKFEFENHDTHNAMNDMLEVIDMIRSNLGNGSARTERVCGSDHISPWGAVTRMDVGFRPKMDTRQVPFLIQAPPLQAQPRITSQRHNNQSHQYPQPKCPIELLCQQVHPLPQIYKLLNLHHVVRHATNARRSVRHRWFPTQE